MSTRFRSLSILLASLVFLATAPHLTGGVTPDQFAKSEEVSLRQSNAKAFRISPSEIQFEIYPSDIHFKDAKGRFQEIDNTIVPVISPVGSVLNGYRYKNRNNSAIVYFGDEDILVRDGDHCVSFMFLGAIPGSRPETASSLRQAGRETPPGLDSMSVLYADLFTGADVVYTVTEHGLKEDIILRSRGSAGVFRFRIISGDLVPRADGRTIVFEDHSGSQISRLGELVMNDSAGHFSSDLGYSLDGADGEWLLSVTASRDFLESEETVYPVIIDPSYSFQWKAASGVTYDTFTSEKYTGTNYGSSQILALSGSPAYEYGITDLFIRFSDVEKIIPYDFPVSSASIVLTSSRKGVSTSLSLSLDVLAVEGSWNEGTLTKKNDFMAKWQTELKTDCVLTGDLMVIDVSEVVQRWNHTAYQYVWGFQIRNNKSSWIEFYSCENPKKELGPKLTVVAQDTTSYALKSRGEKSKSRTVAYFDNMKNSSYSTDLSNAAASWTRTNARSRTGITVTRKTSADPDWSISCDSKMLKNAYGMNVMSQDPKTGYIYLSNIFVNFTFKEMNTASLYRNALFRQSIIAHEIGHTFGLADREDGLFVLLYTEKWSLLDYGADHHVVVVPSRCDILNVLENYK